MAKAKKKAPKKAAKPVAKAKTISKPAKKAAPKMKVAKKPLAAKPTKTAKPVLVKKPVVVAKVDPKALKKKAIEAKPEKAKVLPAPAKGKGPQPEEQKKAKKAGTEAKGAPGKGKGAPEDADDLLDDDDIEAVAPEEVFLTDAEGRRLCRRRDCDQLASVEGYCRYHYLLFWKRIQQRKKILADGKLVNYIEELTSRYPDKYLEMIAKDLRTEKDFLAAIAELEIDESASEEGEFEDDSSFIDEVRGISETPHTREEEDF